MSLFSKDSTITQCHLSVKIRRSHSATFQYRLYDHTVPLFRKRLLDHAVPLFGKDPWIRQCPFSKNIIFLLLKICTNLEFCNDHKTYYANATKKLTTIHLIHTFVSVTSLSTSSPALPVNKSYVIGNERSGTNLMATAKVGPTLFSSCEFEVLSFPTGRDNLQS